jgi:phage/plasmid-like protein (TIGR03299 family)
VVERNDNKEGDMPAVITPEHESTYRMGGVLDEDGTQNLSVDDALQAAGLNWEVRKVPVYVEGHTPGTHIEIPGRFGVQRDTDGAVFGVVGKTWQPTQNRQGFQLVDDLLQIAGAEGRQAWIEHAMPLQGGKKVIVMVRLDTDLQIAGEDYRSYLSFVNGHDGRQSVCAATHDERYVCSNGQIGFLMGQGESNVVRVRHTKNAGSRIKKALQILGLRNKAAEELAKQGEWLVDQEMSDADFEGFLASLMPIKEEDTPAATMIADRRASVMSIYSGSKNLEPIRGTRWGALQSVLEYSDHYRRFDNEDTQMASQLGITAAPLKQAAYNILRDPKLRPLVKA